MDTMGGPILIVQMAGEQASRGVLNFFVFMAVININLGVLNLLPIPILDGGHLVFLGIEAIRKKPLNDKVIAISQRIGLALLLTLMAVVLYNDVMRLITGKLYLSTVRSCGLNRTWAWSHQSDRLDLTQAHLIVQEYVKYRPLNPVEQRHLYDVYKLSILIDMIWFFRRGHAKDFYEKRKVDFLSNLGRNKFFDAIFLE